MKANILVYDVGSTYTKGAAFALADGKLTFLARGQHPTTLENISDGARGAEAEIRAKGVEFAPDMVRFSSCSAAGGLRMVAMGYMPRVTAKAAKEVAMTAGARVMEVVSADEPPEFREEVLREIKPDIILLSGGTDGGDMANVLENADIIFIESPESKEEMMLINKEIPGLTLANMVEGGRTPIFKNDELESFGYNLVIYPTASTYVTTKAMIDLWEGLKRDGTTITQLDKMVPFAQFNELMGLQKIRDIEHTYASSTGR